MLSSMKLSWRIDAVVQDAVDEDVVDEDAAVEDAIVEDAVVEDAAVEHAVIEDAFNDNADYVDGASITSMMQMVSKVSMPLRASQNEANFDDMSMMSTNPSMTSMMSRTSPKLRDDVVAGVRDVDGVVNAVDVDDVDDVDLALNVSIMSMMSMLNDCTSSQ